MKVTSFIKTYIGIILISMVILLSCLFVGSPIKENGAFLYIVIGVLQLGYLCYRKIKKQTYKVIKDKLDICVFLLMIASLLPILTKTQVSFSNTLFFAFRYISLFNSYVIIKDYFIRHPEQKHILYHMILLTGTVFFCFGLDNMTTNYFDGLYRFFENVFVVNIENRMFSTFGYANTFAMYMGIVGILSMGELIQTQKKTGVIFYSIHCFFSFIGILLSASRGTILLFVFVLFLFRIIEKDRKKQAKMLSHGIYQFLLAMLYTKLFGLYLQNKADQMVWIALGILSLFSLFGSQIIQIIIEKIKEKIEKISKKQIYISVAILLGSIILFVVIGLQLTTPLMLFQSKNGETQSKYKIHSIQPNTEYTFTFDVEANANVENLDVYTIRIIEEDKYYDTVKEQEPITFHNFTGTKQIQFTTQDTTVEIALIFETKNAYCSEGLIIKKCDINGTPYPLKYAYLPFEIVNKVRELNFSNKSIWERISVMKDAVTLSSQNNFLGLGGNAWQYRYEEVEEYAYDVIQIHSYPIEVLVEFGILGFLAFCGILYYCVKGAKRAKDNLLILTIAFILLHSMIDFDLAFFHPLFILFLLLAMLPVGKTTENKIIQSVAKTITILVTFIVILTNGLFLVGNKKIQKIYQGTNIRTMIENQTWEDWKQQYEREPYYETYFVLERMVQLAEKEEQFEYLYQIYEKELKRPTYHLNRLLERDESVIQTIEAWQQKPGTEEWIKKLKQQFLASKPMQQERLKEKEKTRMKQEEREEIEQKIEKLYEKTSLHS